MQVIKLRKPGSRNEKFISWNRCDYNRKLEIKECLQCRHANDAKAVLSSVDYGEDRGCNSKLRKKISEASHWRRILPDFGQMLNASFTTVPLSLIVIRPPRQMHSR